MSREDAHEEESRQEKILTPGQVQSLLDVHRKVKGSYGQLTALLNALDIRVT